MNKELKHISTILIEIMNLYAKTQKALLSETKCSVDDIANISRYNNRMLIDDINSLLNTKVITSGVIDQKTELHLLEFDKMIAWHQLYLVDQEQHRLDGHNFNVFRLFLEFFSFNIRETMHSKLIKFLLDKNESHGQGTKFLEILLDRLDVYKPAMGQWEVTAEQGSIDILLKRKMPHSIIVIENKSNWAQDQPNQLYRYWYNQIYSSVSRLDTRFYKTHENEYQIIYLAPNLNKEIEEQSLRKPKDWTDNLLPSKIPLTPRVFTFDAFIQDWLGDCENELKENNRVRQYIAQYKELCKTL